MIYMDEIKGLVCNREYFYRNLKGFKYLGFEVDKFQNLISTAIDSLINNSTIKTTTTYDSYEESLIVQDNRFKLPFDDFSIISNSTESTLIFVISRLPNINPEHTLYIDGLTDAFKCFIFQKYTASKISSWELCIPMIVGFVNGRLLITIDGHSNNTTYQVVVERFRRYAKLEELSKWLHTFGCSEDEVNSDPLQAYFRGFLYIFLTDLTYINSKVSYLYKAPPTTKITPMQVSKAKKPLWEYHLIKIKDTEREISNKGGTHSPHRFHKVRGFHREYKHDRYINMKGKRQWIDPFERGDPSLGIIESDYVAADGNR